MPRWASPPSWRRDARPPPPPPAPPAPRPPQADIAALLNSTCTPESNLALGEGVARLLAAAAGDARRQALLFRAFLMTACAGDMNSLFAGSG